MASDLMKNNQFQGKSVSDVWEALGYHDGHFKNDVWQLVFLVDEKRVVTSMAIYKNCCEK